MSNRSRGDYHERRTRELLETRGWIIIRTAGSLGPADLVALKHDRPPLFVNCKITGMIRPDDHDKTFIAAIRAGAIPVLAWRGDPGHIEFRAMTRPRTLAGRAFLDKWIRHYRRTGLPSDVETLDIGGS